MPPTCTQYSTATVTVHDLQLCIFRCRWDDCKQLLLSQNFFESLRFFDRDNVPRRKLKALEKMIVKNSDLESVEHGSRAAVPLHMWITALVDYHKAKVAVQPSRVRLANAERTREDVSLMQSRCAFTFSSIWGMKG